MLLFIEALGITQELFIIVYRLSLQIVSAPNVSSYVLTQPHTIAHI